MMASNKAMSSPPGLDAGFCLVTFINRGPWEFLIMRQVSVKTTSPPAGEKPNRAVTSGRRADMSARKMKRPVCRNQTLFLFDMGCARRINSSHKCKKSRGQKVKCKPFLHCEKSACGFVLPAVPASGAGRSCFAVFQTAIRRHSSLGHAQPP